jgi:phosphopantetheinyl transferase
VPLIERNKIGPQITYGIWKIEEPASYFEVRLDLSRNELDQISTLKGRRKLEWLASRWVVHMIADHNQRIELKKDLHGRPFMAGFHHHISISHTNGYTTAILADKPAGIDIQVRVEKIYRIDHKFLSEEELANINPLRRLEFLHVYWGAKECLYKAYGRRQLDFKRDLVIQPFNLEQRFTKGLIKKESPSMTFDIYFECRKDYVFVYSIQS